MFVRNLQAPDLNLKNGIRIGTRKFAQSLGYQEMEDRKNNSEELNTRIDNLLFEFQFVNKDRKADDMSTDYGKLRIDTARAYLSSSLHKNIYSREDLPNIIKGLTFNSGDTDNKIEKLLNRYLDPFVDAFVSCFFKEGYFLISALQSGHVKEKIGPLEQWLKSTITILNGVAPSIDEKTKTIQATDKQRKQAADIATKLQVSLMFVDSVWNFCKKKKLLN